MIDEKKIDRIRASRSPFKLWDVLVFGVAIVLVAVLLMTLYSDTGEQVEIVYGGQDGQKWLLPLNEDCERVIDGKLTVVIAGGECWVKCSTCDHKTCEKTGKIKYVYQQIVCAQNSIVITVVGQSSIAGIVGQ